MRSKRWYWVLLPFVVVVASIALLVLGYGLTRPTPIPSRQALLTTTHQSDGTAVGTRMTVTASPSPTSAHQAPLPTVGDRLVIPSIGVNAPIEPVGLTNGKMAVPSVNPWTDVGWYDLGTRPGEQGSAVIDGHLNRPGGCCIPAVFWNLKLIKVGATVQVVEPASHITYTFLVVGTATLANNAPTQDIFGKSTGTFLNLITCAGDWIVGQRQTTQRFVVYTARV